jgi:Na+/melibiose symporter-like transporter
MCGQWLNTVVFPINYQAMYAFGFVTSLLSMVFLMRLRIPDSPDEGDDLPGEKPRGLRDAARQMRVGLQSTGERMRAKPAFLRITVNTFLHGVGVWMAAPLYALYFVRELNASDAWLGLNGTIASVGTIVGYSLWRSLLVRWGEPVSLKRTIVLIGVYPVLVGLTPSLAVILLYGALNGLVAPGVNLAHFNLLLKATPANARPRFTALYMTIMNIGAFFSPILAVALADQIGLAPMLIIAGLLSVIGSTSFWWNPVLREEPETAPALASGE